MFKVLFYMLKNFKHVQNTKHEIQSAWVYYHSCLTVFKNPESEIAQLSDVESKLLGLLGGPVVKYPPANAGDTGSITDLETQIRHVPGQLGLCTTKKKKKYSKHLYFLF